MEKRRVIALIDPVWGGHSRIYFAIFWKTLAQMSDVKVAGFCPQPDAAREFLKGYAIMNPEIHPLPVCTTSAKPGGFAAARQKISQWKHLARSLKHAETGGLVKIDLAVIIWMEPLMERFVLGPIIDHLFPYSWVGLYLHPYEFRMKQSRRYLLRDTLFPSYTPLLARRCKAILTLDEGIVEAMERKTGKPVLRLPDFTDTALPDAESELAKQIKTKSAGRMACGLFGVLQKRKGILHLLHAVEKKPQDWFFVFGGELPRNDYSESEWNFVQQFVSENHDNCLLWPKLIPDETSFNSAVAACDVIFAAYDNFAHSSNLMTKAALFKKPVIVSPGFLMAERVKKFRLGWILPRLSADSILELLNGLDREKLQPASQKALFSEYSAEHDDKCLARVLAQIVKSE
ncbi:MAG: hypothetical protein WDM80_10075 [Limisphaerales bacterium]